MYIQSNLVNIYVLHIVYIHFIIQYMTSKLVTLPQSNLTKYKEILLLVSALFVKKAPKKLIIFFTAIAVTLTLTLTQFGFCVNGAQGDF